MSETVLIVGSGAREHAIAEALRRSASNPSLTCFGSTRNPGIASLCSAYRVGETTDAIAVAEFARTGGATLALVGPEAPLAAGVADALRSAGVAVVGPSASLARIESSKSFARNLLAKYDIAGNPDFARFESMDGVNAWLSRFPDRHVVKDDGLAGGKGVKVYGDHLHTFAESLAFCEQLAAAGRPFVLEEKLDGEEFSLLSFSDGETLRHMPAVQDHKRAYDGDTGPNTGGMGTYTDADGSLPFLRGEDIRAAQRINEFVVAALREECGKPYRGVLYGGFMATAQGVRLVEYNARFGDPEALNLLTLLTSDFLALCACVARGTLADCDVTFRSEASVCKYLVPEGYPDEPRRGDTLTLPDADDVTVYLGSVDEREGRLEGAGSRAAAVVGTGATLAEAEQHCQRWLERFSGPYFFRRDIGTSQSIAQRVRHMQELRGR